MQFLQFLTQAFPVAKFNLFHTTRGRTKQEARERLAAMQPHHHGAVERLRTIRPFYAAGLRVGTFDAAMRRADGDALAGLLLLGERQHVIDPAVLEANPQPDTRRIGEAPAFIAARGTERLFHLGFAGTELDASNALADDDAGEGGWREHQQSDGQQ